MAPCLAALFVLSLAALRAQTPPAALKQLESAQRFFQQQQWDKAEATALEALRLDPDYADAEVLLGLLATARSQFSEAERRFKRAVSLEPRNYRARGYLGSTYLQQKRYDEAAREYRHVLQLDPANPSANYNLGLVALIRGKPAEALSYFRAVHHAAPSDPGPLIGMLESELMLKMPDAAKTLSQLRELLRPNDPRLFQVATLLARHAETASAIQMYQELRKNFPNSYDVAYNLALVYMQAGRYTEAAATISSAPGPDRAEAFDLLGTIEEKRRRPAESERAFARAAQLEPQNENYRFDFANALLQHGKQQEALEAFLGAVQEIPRSWRLRVGLGAAYYLAARYDEAAHILLDSLQFKPEPRVAYFLLGETYEAAGTRKPAIAAALHDYVRQKPRDEWAYYHYASILFERAQAEHRDDFAAARAQVQEALKLNPSFAEAWLLAGMMAQAENKLEESAGALEKAVSLDPALAAAHYRLALAYQRLGNQEEAKAQLAAFRSLKNEGRYRSRVLEALGRTAR